MSLLPYLLLLVDWLQAILLVQSQLRKWKKAGQLSWNRKTIQIVKRDPKQA